MIVKQADANEVLRLHDGISVTIVDSQHRHVEILEVHNDPNPEYKRTQDPLSLFITPSVNVKAQCGMDKTNTSI